DWPKTGPAPLRVQPPGIASPGRGQSQFLSCLRQRRKNALDLRNHRGGPVASGITSIESNGILSTLTILSSRDFSKHLNFRNRGEFELPGRELLWINLRYRRTFRPGARRSGSR